jgi:hypothetical protein
VAHDPLVGADWQRPEGRTLMTYPEWHIVHAYEDYAAVIRTGDPDDFGFLSSIGDFWSSTCALVAGVRAAWRLPLGDEADGLCDRRQLYRRTGAEGRV